MSGKVRTDPGPRIDSGHKISHGQGGLCQFYATIVIGIQASNTRLLVVFKQVNAVDDGNFVDRLQLSEGKTDGLANMLGMRGFAP